MGPIAISTVLWDSNEQTWPTSRCYNEKWARKLFDGFRRNLTIPTRCVLFTDRQRSLPSWIEQVVDPTIGANSYADCVRPFVLNEPMIFAGLDTVVVGNCDKFARYCFEADKIALPRHPYEPVAINGVVLCPGGLRQIFDDWRGENDMEWMRRWPHNIIDDLWPGRVLSYKAHVAGRPGIGKASIIYFHGSPKPHALSHVDFVRRHWV